MIDPDEDEVPAPWYMIIIPVALLTMAFGLPIAYFVWAIVNYGP